MAKQKTKNFGLYQCYKKFLPGLKNNYELISLI